jgi:hypothetical protein
MKTFKLFFILMLLAPAMWAQINSPDSSARPFEYVIGLGISNQFTKQVSPHIRFESRRPISQKFQLYGAVSYSKKSIGDTFSILISTYYNDGAIVGSAYYKSSITTFNLADLSLGVRYTPNERFAFRFAPALTQIIKAVDIEESGFVSVNSAGTHKSNNTYYAFQLDGIKTTLFGVDLGVDFSLAKWLSLNYCTYLRFSDVSQDEIYGPQKDRIMQSTLSLNYIIR